MKRKVTLFWWLLYGNDFSIWSYCFIIIPIIGIIMGLHIQKTATTNPTSYAMFFIFSIISGLLALYHFIERNK